MKDPLERLRSSKHNGNESILCNGSPNGTLSCHCTSCIHMTITPCTPIVNSIVYLWL